MPEFNLLRSTILFFEMSFVLFKNKRRCYSMTDKITNKNIRNFITKIRAKGCALTRRTYKHSLLIFHNNPIFQFLPYVSSVAFKILTFTKTFQFFD